MSEIDVKSLADGINGKLDTHEANMKSLSDKIEAVEKYAGSTDEIKKELNAINEEHKKSSSELMDLVKKAQAHADELDVQLKKKGSNKVVSRKGLILEAANEKAAELKQLSVDGQGKVSLSVKAGDMTQANTYTNDVAATQLLNGTYFNPDRAVNIRNFMNVIPTTAGSIRYIQETAFDDGTAAKTEGSAAGQSDFDLTEQTANVKSIATYMTMSKEMLEDTPFLAGYINARLFSKLLKEEDDQILHGTGAGANISGLSVNASAYSDLLADSKVNRFDVLFNALTNAYNNEYVPNAIFVNPTDYMLLATEKDDNGMPIYPAQILSGGMLTVNGVPVIKSTAVTSDEFFVGDFRLGSTLAVRQDVNVSFSSEHSTNFIDGNVTVMAEERVALPIHNTQAFVYGDFSNALALGSN